MTQTTKQDALYTWAGTYSPPAIKRRSLHLRRLAGAPLLSVTTAIQHKRKSDPHDFVTKEILQNFLLSCTMTEINDNIPSMQIMGLLAERTIDWLIKWASRDSSTDPTLSAHSAAVLAHATFPVERVAGVKDKLFASNAIKTVIQVATEHQLQLSQPIHSDELEFGEKIGAGAGGFVYQARYNGHDVAVKRFQFDGMWMGRECEFHYEAAILSVFGSFKNFLHCFGVNYQEGFIVMPLAVNGSLDYLIASGELANWCWDGRIRLAKQIASALRRLHQYGIIHRDVKPANVVLDNKYNCYLADFGASSSPTKTISGPGTRRKRSMTLNVGTNIYMAPEVVEGDGKYGEAIDVFSFGLLLWQIVTGCSHPYLDQGIPLREVSSFVASGSRLDIPTTCPPALASLIESCWDHNPKKRPTAEQIHTLLCKM